VGGAAQSFTELSDSRMLRIGSCVKEEAGDRVGEGEESCDTFW